MSVSTLMMHCKTNSCSCLHAYHTQTRAIALQKVPLRMVPNPPGLACSWVAAAKYGHAMLLVCLCRA